MDGGAWWATVHRVAKSQTRLSDYTSLHFTVIVALDQSIPKDINPEYSLEELV